MDESTTTVRLPDAAVRRFGHVCGFFHSQEEEYRVSCPDTTTWSSARTTLPNSTPVS
jgi:hypothetical protein